MSKFALGTLFLSLFSNWWIIFFRRFASAADPNSENNRDPNLPLCLSCIRQYCWCCQLPSPDISGSSAKIIAGNIKVFIEWRRMKRRLDFPVQFGMLLSILKEHPSKAVETNLRVDLSFTITSKPEIETPITDAPYDFGVRIQFHIYFIPWDPFSLVFY